jgi:(1->4)-alpha-D-glucan 1-alpha-D-glucosylmutase
MTPRATYRLQFNAGFGFGDGAALAPYLAALGISHVYASPIFAARPGSTHGYDVVDPCRISPKLGGEAGFRAMVAALHAEGLGLIIDVVPNHMGIGGAANDYWLDVLAWGSDSRYAAWFDIDWNAPHPGLAGKVLVPVLGEAYGAALAAGKLELRADAVQGSFAVWAEGTHQLPVCPRHYHEILRVGGSAALAERAAALAASSPADPRWQPLRAAIAEAAAAGEFDVNLPAFRGRPEEPSSWSRLDALIRLQSWRPAKFSLDSDAINYRRFFTISDLAALRVEDSAVFESTHALVVHLLEEGLVDGLRIDHIDGLRDPKAYARRLRARASRPFYFVVEKILGPGESLPVDWGIDGTTGYEFANLLTGLLADAAGSEALTRAYVDFTGCDDPANVVLQACKRRVMLGPMRVEVEALTARLLALATSDRRFADLGRGALRAGIVQVLAALDVYRTYADADGIGADDRGRIDIAVARAQAAAPELDLDVFRFIQAVLTLDHGSSRPEVAAAVLEATLRAQQLSGPVTAKGLEDTALYRFNRLIALNEVGSEPGRFAATVGEFHRANAARQIRTPATMLATSTHDTKRGEDARARIIALSGQVPLWVEMVEEWHRLLADPARPIDRNEEYFFYQSLIGAWPMDMQEETAPTPDLLEILADRLDATMLKAAREAGVNTRWVFGDPGYEADLSAFVRRALDPERAFLRSFRAFEAVLGPAGRRNTIVQAVLKLTVPGVPDFYQGAELWEQSLVDPDNRRPVDFTLRRAMLDEVGERPPGELSGASVKLALVRTLLALRRTRPGLFSEGSYEPLEASGPASAGLCAFARRRGRDILVVATTLCPRDGTGEILAPNGTAGPWKDVLSGLTHRTLAVSDLFATLPAAVLVPADTP